MLKNIKRRIINEMNKSIAESSELSVALGVAFTFFL